MTAINVDELDWLDSCTMSDALDSLGHAGSTTGVHPLWEGARAIGRAVTMSLAEGPAPTLGVHLGVGAIELANTGDIIVVDNRGRTTMGAWGGLLSTAATAKGLAGVVIDGACRDVDEARTMNLPIFGRAPVSLTARGRAHEVSVGEPVQLGGVRVRAGDLVVADGSGVVVVPSELVSDALERASAIAARENDMARRLRDGATPSEVLGAAYEGMLRGGSTPTDS